MVRAAIVVFKDSAATLAVPCSNDPSGVEYEAPALRLALIPG